MRPGAHAPLDRRRAGRARRLAGGRPPPGRQRRRRLLPSLRCHRSAASPPARHVPPVPDRLPRVRSCHRPVPLRRRRSDAPPRGAGAGGAAPRDRKRRGCGGRRARRPARGRRLERPVGRGASPDRGGRQLLSDQGPSVPARGGAGGARGLARRPVRAGGGGRHAGRDAGAGEPARHRRPGHLHRRDPGRARPDARQRPRGVAVALRRAADHAGRGARAGHAGGGHPGRRHPRGGGGRR